MYAYKNESVQEPPFDISRQDERDETELTAI